MSEGSSEQDAFEYVYSTGFPGLLQQLGAVLMFTTYQAGKLVVLRSDGQRVSALLRHFPKPMGVAVDRDRLALGVHNQIIYMQDDPHTAAQLETADEKSAVRNTHDACYLPMFSYVTSDIQVHEMAWGADDNLWVVNTRFSCLCHPSLSYSFEPVWRPPFITELAAEDRCHLNGVAMVGGQPRYVTAMGQTNERQGWRDNKVSGGVVLEVPTGEVVAQGLAMPHSPRVWQGRLWVLNSGLGAFQLVDEQSGQLETVVSLPGYTRGLAFAGKYAFVGTSMIREKRHFGGLQIEKLGDDLRCGVFAIDLETGRVAEFMEFRKGCTELFDVQVLTEHQWPSVIGLAKHTIDNIFLLPPLNEGAISKKNF